MEIDYAANTIYVDGEEIPQDYILEPMEQKSWQTISTITVPEGEVFVMGVIFLPRARKERFSMGFWMFWMTWLSCWKPSWMMRTS